MISLSQQMIISGLCFGFASANWICDDGHELPSINLQVIHLHDMGAAQRVMEFRSYLPEIVADLEAEFGPETETALATFVDKPYAQHLIDTTWCYKKEFDFGVAPNSQSFQTSMDGYGTFLGQDYSAGDSQLDPAFIALRRANEFTWRTDEWGSNGKVNVRVFSFATNQHPLNAGNHTENSVLPPWSDDAHEQCEAVNYPSVDQMRMAVQNLKSYFLFLVDGGESHYGDEVINYYSAIPNSVTVDLATITTVPTRSTFGGVMFAALKKLFCDVVDWPEPCTVPDTLVPNPNCECSCKVMAEVKEKFDSHCW